MGYGNEVYTAANRKMAERRRRADAELEIRKKELYGRYPRAREIEQALGRTAVAAARAVFSGADAKAHLEALRQSNKALQNELSGILTAAGLPYGYLEPPYSCAHCQDTGSIDGQMCTCMKQLLREEAYRGLNEMTPLSLSTFEGFDLSFYSGETDGKGPSAQEEMDGILSNCISYARGFSTKSPSLIFTGGTGLGKTHLSLAIAGTVIGRGFGVVYGTASGLVDRLEREHFGREAETDTFRHLTECDLLILDDLGTEFKSSFTVAEIYNIINTRQLSQRPTVISTNLSMRELQERYSERLASRILGGYIRMPFCGNDVRLQKRMRRTAKP